MAEQREEQVEGGGRRVELPGRGVTFVRETGPRDAPPVLLLHGLGVTAGINFGQVLAPLGATRRVIAMDLRGHGRGVDAEFSLEACAADAVALLDVLEIERATLVGYSMGGPISQLITRGHEERVVGLVQCATAKSFVDPFAPNAGLTVAALSAMASNIPDQARDRLARFVWRSGPRPPMRDLLRELRPVDRSALVKASVECLRFNSSDWFGDLDVPVAAVVTTRDAVVPAYRQLKLARAAKDHTVHLLEGDHMACVRRPERFASQLGAACDSVSVRARVL